MKTDSIEKLLPSDKIEWSIREIESQMPFTEKWLREQEKEGHLKFTSPKVRGQVMRLFNRQDVVNALRLVGFRMLGFSPRRVKRYKSMIQQWRREGAHLQTKQFKRIPGVYDDQVLLFDLRDLFPDGDVESIDWEELDAEPNWGALEELKAIYAEAYFLRTLARNNKAFLDQVERDTDKFLKGLAKGLKRCLGGFNFLQLMKK